MISFIDDRREVYGIEPIYQVLPIAPSTYHDNVAKRVNPAKLSERVKRDAILRIEVRRVFVENFSVYGVQEVWRQMMSEGFVVAQCTVSRLKRESVPAAISRMPTTSLWTTSSTPSSTP